MYLYPGGANVKWGPRRRRGDRGTGSHASLRAGVGMTIVGVGLAICIVLEGKFQRNDGRRVGAGGLSGGGVLYYNTYKAGRKEDVRCRDFTFYLRGVGK